MKLGLSPLLFALFLLVPSGAVRAAPRSQDGALDPKGRLSVEDALFDGDLDAEDLVARGLAQRHVARAAPGGQAWLSLVGFARRNIAEEREIGGFLVVGLPLDRFGRRSTRGALANPPSPPARPVPPAPLTPAAARASEGNDLVLTPRLARSCVAAAWHAAGLGADDARLDAIVSRARWSALLPEARLRAVRFDDERLSTDVGTESSRWRDSAGANVGLEARLTWRLDRLLYADDEPSFERMRLERRDARSRAAGKVLETLFHWQRAWLDLRTLPADQRGTRDEADIALRLMEAEAALDVLTGGWFAAWRGSPRSGAVPLPQPPGSDL